MDDGHYEAEYPITRIIPKGTYRRDLGDIDALVDSMRRLGLLAPLVVMGDGHLLCGRRRLAAVIRLGWTTVPVWIPDKVSEAMRLAALYDDETLRKPLTPTEQAELYAEYEKLYAAQARLRQEATRFGGHSGDDAGNAESARPSHGSTRAQAARAVTGTKSYNRLSQVRDLQRIAVDKLEDASVRNDAQRALVEVDQDGRVNPRWDRVVLHQMLAGLDRFAIAPDVSDAARAAATEGADVVRHEPSTTKALRAARQAIARVDRLRSPERQVQPDAQARRTLREVTSILRSESGWWDAYDPVTFGRFAGDDQRNLVESYVDGVRRFFEAAQAARAAKDVDSIV